MIFAGVFHSLGQALHMIPLFGRAPDEFSSFPRDHKGALIRPQHTAPLIVAPLDVLARPCQPRLAIHGAYKRLVAHDASAQPHLVVPSSNGASRHISTTVDGFEFVGDLLSALEIALRVDQDGAVLARGCLARPARTRLARDNLALEVVGDAVVGSVETVLRSR